MVSPTSENKGFDPTSFRVVIVGGGPVGLTLAHALSAVGIDYVLLEKRTSFTDDNTGTNLAAWPHIVRVFHQLGLLEDLYKIQVPSPDKNLMGPGGEMIMENILLMDAIAANHGYPYMLFFRPDLIKVLYTRLPDKSKLLPSKSVVDIHTTPSGVTVSCSDGSLIHGSIVVGADGVHSRVRGIMSSLALASDGTSLNPQPSFTAPYLVLTGWLDPLPETVEGKVYEVRGRDAHHQIVCAGATPTGQARMIFISYVTLPVPRVGDKPCGFTEDDMHRVAGSIAHQQVHPKYTFADLWERRRSAWLTDGKEGVVRDWHWDGRVVLLGDAAHKMGAQLGLGMGTGVQSAVVLVNELRKLQGTTMGELSGSVYTDDEDWGESGRGVAGPTKEELEAAFRRYREARRGVVWFTVLLSKVQARTLAWGSWMLKVLDTKVMPLVGGDMRMADWVLAPMASRGLVLDGVEERGRLEGRVRWKNFARV